jgi:hypothetical protein
MEAHMCPSRSSKGGSTLQYAYLRITALSSCSAPGVLCSLTYHFPQKELAMTAQHRPRWLATAIGIGIFLVVCTLGFTVIALVAPAASW